MSTMASADVQFLTDKTIFQSVSDGQSVYLLTPDGVLFFEPGTAPQMYSPVNVITNVTIDDYRHMNTEEKERVEKGITHIIMGNDGLWGINAYVGLVGRINTEGVEFEEVTFDTSHWFDAITCPIDIPLNAFAENETIYIQLSDGLEVWQLENFTTYKVSIPVTVFQCISYRPHQALLNIQASSGEWSSTLYTLDLSTWQVSPLEIQLPELATSNGGVAITRLAWHEEEERLVVQMRGNDFLDDGMICQSVSGSPMERVSVLYATGTMHLISNGVLVWVQDGRAISYSLSQLNDLTGKPLVMKGLIHQDDSIYQEFLARHPHVNILRSVSDWTIKDVEGLVNHSNTPDVFSLYANQLYQNIRCKEYALPLEDKVELIETVDSMYPIYQSLLKNSIGQVVAMPTMVSINLLTVDEPLWNETFGEDTPYPSTYLELFRLMVMWEERYSDLYPDVNVTDDWGLASLLSRLIEQYVLAYENSNAPISFDSPAFRDTLTAFCSLMDVIDQEHFEQNAVQGNRALLSTCNVSSLFHMDNSSIILLPLQIESEQVAIRADVVVLLGNCYSRLQEEVISLIEHLSMPENLSIEARYALFPAYDQPITYQHGKVERTITQMGIDAYHYMLPHIKLSATSRYLSQSDSESPFAQNVQPLIRQFVSRSITLEQFCRQMNRISNMIWAE